ncbi:hypothetical protein GGX14DRAFT_408885 [Mycena pura]|uniref:Uncharacterized protein n=1 Tax=Mycena pura TaxID=153505 RepID=A0AAD6UND0_9AGAR|nr:hypothetical protein GGX14DRAFT_408885 [Mycena pura]
MTSVSLIALVVAHKFASKAGGPESLGGCDESDQSGTFNARSSQTYAPDPRGSPEQESALGCARFNVAMKQSTFQLSFVPSACIRHSDDKTQIGLGTSSRAGNQLGLTPSIPTQNAWKMVPNRPESPCGHDRLGMLPHHFWAALALKLTNQSAWREWELGPSRVQVPTVQSVVFPERLARNGRDSDG